MRANTWFAPTPNKIGEVKIMSPVGAAHRLFGSKNRRVTQKNIETSRAETLNFLSNFCEKLLRVIACYVMME